jgi:hypothetical protein
MILLAFQVIFWASFFPGRILFFCLGLFNSDFFLGLFKSSFLCGVFSIIASCLFLFPTAYFF